MLGEVLEGEGVGNLSIGVIRWIQQIMVNHDTFHNDIVRYREA